MDNTITQIELDRLLPHPDNPNRMSKENFRKLVRNIERTGRYEPLIVRLVSLRETGTQNAIRDTQYEIINGHHRFEALKQLGRQTCDCVVWEIDDDEARLLLSTLNRLCGQDVLEKKAALLEKINNKFSVDELSKLLPNTKTQIKRLLELQKDRAKIRIIEQDKNSIAYPMVFFLNTEQKAIVEKAIERASSINSRVSSIRNRASRNAQAITQISKSFVEYRVSSIENQESEVTDGKENQVRTTGTC